MSDDRDWASAKRVAWWTKTIAMAAAIAATSLAAHKWILSRASVEYVEQRIETREPKENARVVESRLERKVDQHQEVLTNVRDNLLILMDRQRMPTKPLPGEP